MKTLFKGAICELKERTTFEYMPFAFTKQGVDSFTLLNTQPV